MLFSHFVEYIPDVSAFQSAGGIVRGKRPDARQCRRPARPPLRKRSNFNSDFLFFIYIRWTGARRSRKCLEETASSRVTRNNIAIYWAYVLAEMDFIQIYSKFVYTISTNVKYSDTTKTNLGTFVISNTQFKCIALSIGNFLCTQFIFLCFANRKNKNAVWRRSKFKLRCFVVGG